MAKVKGSLNEGNNFNITKLGPIDARTVVETLSDLINPNTWKENGENLNPYNGMLVMVLEDDSLWILDDGGGAVKNPVNHTVMTSWHRVDSRSLNYTGSDTVYIATATTTEGVTYTFTSPQLVASGNTYVDLHVSGTTEHPNEGHHLWVTADVADTKATLTAATANNQLAGAYGVKEWINSLNKATQAEENSVIYDVTEESGLTKATSKLITDIKLSGYTVGADTSGKVAETDTLGGALGKLQGQINGLDYSADAGTDKVITAITETNGKVSVSTQNVTSRVITGYAEGSDAKIAATDTLGGALGKVQGQINAMDKAASSATGQFVRTVVEADGKVTEQKSYIVADDVKITAATASEVTSLGANVKEAWKIVNQEGTRLGDFVKIYKDSSIAEIYLGTSADTVNATTGAIDKKSGDKESLNYVYYTSGGTYSITHIDLETFLTEPEFKSGVTVTNHIAHGVVSGNSESVVTAYTATGGANGTAKVLGVDGGGFYVNNIQTAINAKVNSAISLLDSSSATTSAGYYMTGITITDGKVTAIGQAQLSAQETELSTGNSTTATGNVVTGLSVSDHAITLNKKNFPEVAWKRVTAGGTNIDAATTADTISVVTGNTAITLAGDATNKKITISHTDTSSQASIDAGAGKFIKSVSVDTYGHVTGLTTGDTVNSATTAADSAKVAGKTVGNANGNVPLSNGTVNTNLNADMVDGKHISVVTALPTTKDANTIYILI